MPKLPDFEVFERRRGHSGFDKSSQLMENRNGLKKEPVIVSVRKRKKNERVINNKKTPK
ncbi:hypothetical protein D3C81_1751630 [compost metagenome]|nr:hypothetical protein J53TS2_08600 [Paenibacillus sp. J53TS2]